MARGNRILALDQTGWLRLIHARPERYEVLSERQVTPQESWAHVVVADSQVLVRDIQGLTVWDWKRADLSAR